MEREEEMLLKNLEQTQQMEDQVQRAFMNFKTKFSNDVRTKMSSNSTMRNDPSGRTKFQLTPLKGRNGTAESMSIFTPIATPGGKKL